MPILIGVIVLGFVIGAGLSLSGRHDAAVVAVASPSPPRSETFVPVTPAPTEKPTPPPTAAPAATQRTKIAPAAPATALAATPVPATATPARVTPHVLAAPHRLAAVTATAEPVADGAPPAPPTPFVKPRVTTVPTEAADASVEAPATLKPATAAPEATVAAPLPAPVQGDSSFARLSAAVVRQYLESLKRGDQAAAFAVLAAPPASEQQLAEYGVVDARTSVGRIDAHGAANDDAFVSVQMDTPSGPYFGQYTVHKSDTGAAVITAHSIVKP